MKKSISYFHKKYYLQSNCYKNIIVIKDIYVYNGWIMDEINEMNEMQHFRK